MPASCGEDSVIAAATDDVPTEVPGAVTGTLAAANGLKDKGVAVVEVAGGALVVPVFGRPRTLVDMLEMVTAAVVVWIGAENEKVLGELNPPN